MNYSLQVRRGAVYRNLPDRRASAAPSRVGYLLAVSATLAAVTFTLIYLSAFSGTAGF